MKEGRFIALCFFALFLLGCSDNDISPSDYADRIIKMDNGLVKTKELGPVKYEVQYIPPELAALNSLGTENLKSDEYEKEVEALKELFQFKLSISLPGSEANILHYGISGNAEYERRFHYVSFKMEKNFYLISNEDSLVPVLYHFSPDYGLSNKMTCVVAFDPGKIRAEEIVLCFWDQVFDGGLLKFRFDRDKLKNISKPKII